MTTTPQPSDGACADCCRRYGDEYGFPDLVVDDITWAEMVKGGEGLLCPSCMCKRAYDAGLSNAHARFTSGPFCEGVAPHRLGFHELRRANVERCEQVFHKVDDWSPCDWATAFAGECGEACNEVKKLRRLDGADSNIDTPAERSRIVQAIGKELADAVIYADLLATRLGLNLGECIRQKFNEVSSKRGSTVMLGICSRKDPKP